MKTPASLLQFGDTVMLESEEYFVAQAVPNVEGSINLMLSPVNPTGLTREFSVPKNFQLYRITSFERRY